MKLTVVLLLLMPLVVELKKPGERDKVDLRPGDPVVRDGLKFINQFYSTRGDKNVRRLTRVVMASLQTIAGESYDLELQVYHSKYQDEICTLNIWYRVWLPPPDNIQFPEQPVCNPVNTTQSESNK